MEVWDSREALAAHFATAQMRGQSRERAELGFSERQMSPCELGPAEAI
jgi:quinol monooxygenase YgiN